MTTSRDIRGSPTFARALLEILLVAGCAVSAIFVGDPVPAATPASLSPAVRPLGPASVLDHFLSMGGEQLDRLAGDCIAVRLDTRSYASTEPATGPARPDLSSPPTGRLCVDRLEPGLLRLRLELPAGASHPASAPTTFTRLLAVTAAPHEEVGP